MGWGGGSSQSVSLAWAFSGVAEDRGALSALSAAEQGEFMEDAACERGLTVAVGFQHTKTEGKLS